MAEDWARMAALFNEKPGDTVAFEPLPKAKTYRICVGDMRCRRAPRRCGHFVDP